MCAIEDETDQPFDSIQFPANQSQCSSNHASCLTDLCKGCVSCLSWSCIVWPFCFPVCPEAKILISLDLPICGMYTSVHICAYCNLEEYLCPAVQEVRSSLLMKSV